MAGRSSFKKTQKEAARREKRQIKLARRQGRQSPDNISPSLTQNEEQPLTQNEELPTSVDADNDTSASSSK